MVTFHIFIFHKWHYGGAHGGAPVFNDQNNIHFKKSQFFELKNALEAIGTPPQRPPMYAKSRPPIRPSISAPLHPPPHELPSCSLENVSFFQNWGKSMSFIGQYKANAPHTLRPTGGRPQAVCQKRYIWPSTSVNVSCHPVETIRVSVTDVVAWDGERVT